MKKSASRKRLKGIDDSESRRRLQDIDDNDIGDTVKKLATEFLGLTQRDISSLDKISEINVRLRMYELRKEHDDIIDNWCAEKKVNMSNRPVGMNCPEIRKFYERIVTTKYNDADYAATQELIVYILNVNIEDSAGGRDPGTQLMQLLHAQMLAKALDDKDPRKSKLVQAIAQKKKELSLQCTAKPVENLVLCDYKDTSDKNELPKQIIGNKHV